GRQGRRAAGAARVGAGPPVRSAAVPAPGPGRVAHGRLRAVLDVGGPDVLLLLGRARSAPLAGGRFGAPVPAHALGVGGGDGDALVLRRGGAGDVARAAAAAARAGARRLGGAVPAGGPASRDARRGGARGGPGRGE